MAVVLLLCAVGCEEQSKPTPAAASASASAKAAPKPTSTVAAPKPKPLDVKKLTKSLKCGGDGHGPCEVLDSFKECKKWNPITQSGDGRWMGTGYAVTKGKFIEEVTLMRSRRVPQSEVGPGQLSVKIGLTKIPDNRGPEQTHAKKAIRAFSHGDVTKRGNSAVRYLEERSDWPEAFVMQADANQIYVAVAGGGFLCADGKGQRVLAVRLSGNREHPADGVYAILYPVKW